MQDFDPFDGAILVDKPAGPTSHDVVEAVRQHFQIKKVGHAGTLDPNATGLLLLLLGRGTKLSEKLMAADKVYSGAMMLGETTDSYDAAGELVASSPVPPLSLEDLNAHAQIFSGDQMQMPPMVSAVKIEGVPLYKLARKGIEVERKPRLIHIYRFRFTDYEEPLAWFRVACTKGTYIRALTHDFGQKIGCGAHLKTLRRLVSGRFDINQAITFEELIRLSRADLLTRIVRYSELREEPSTPA